MQDRQQILENLMGSAALRLLPGDWQSAVLRLKAEAGRLSCRIEAPPGSAAASVAADDRLRVAARLFARHCAKTGRGQLDLCYRFFRSADGQWCWTRQQDSGQNRQMAAV